jgi:hypothetical protein
MQRKIYKAVALLSCCTMINFIYGRQSPKIEIVCTSALTARYYEPRKQQYIRGLSLLKNYGLDPYLVESITSGPTFLDEYCNHVCYTQSNDASLRNYGINEAVSLLIGLQCFNFDPETIIIKLTGRYPLESDEFVRLVEQNLDADVIAKTWTENDACTGLFAIRLKYLLDFLQNYLDFKKMEQEMISVELYFGAYITKIEKEGANVIHLPKMYDYITGDAYSTSAQ